MSMKVETKVSDLVENGIEVFDSTGDNCIILLLDDEGLLTVVSCTKDELKENLKGTEHELE